MHALLGVTAHQTKIPYVAIITVNPRTEPTPPAICLRARMAIAKRHEVVERRAMARQQYLNEIYGAADLLENTGCGINGYSAESGHIQGGFEFGKDPPGKQVCDIQIGKIQARVPFESS
jgi:hypothetical protein